MRLPLALTVFVVALALAAPAAAHLGSTKYVHVEPTAEGAALRVEIEVVDAAVELGLGEDAPSGEVLVRGEEVALWLSRGIALRAEGGACTATPGDVEPVTRDAKAYLAVDLAYRCPEPVRGLVLRDDTVFDGDPRHESIVRVGAGRGDAHVLRAGRREANVGDPAGAGALALTFLWEGVVHLATGYDHVLFLLSLLLAAGFVADREGTKRALRDVAILVTAFTIGHSVTLIAAALGVVVLPSRLVESAIAASIVLVAAHNVFRPEVRGPLPWLAFAFGLVHGFGFSSVLVELGLPRERLVLALLSFNVGIELGQLAFTAVVLGPIAWAARHRSYKPIVVRGGSIAIAAIAAVWLVERIAGS